MVLIWKDGRCRVHRPFEKIFAGTELLHFAKVDAKRVMTVVYKRDHFTYLKRFQFSGTVSGRLYRCTPKGSEILFSTADEPKKIYVRYKPYKGIQILQQYFEPKGVPVKKINGDGKQMTSKEIKDISTELPDWWDHDAKVQRGPFIEQW